MYKYIVTILIGTLFIVFIAMNWMRSEYIINNCIPDFENQVCMYE